MQGKSRVIPSEALRPGAGAPPAMGVTPGAERLAPSGEAVIVGRPRSGGAVFIDSSFLVSPIISHRESSMQFQSLSTFGGVTGLPMAGAGMLEGLPGGLLGRFISRAIATRRVEEPSTMLTIAAERPMELPPSIPGMTIAMQPTVPTAPVPTPRPAFPTVAEQAIEQDNIQNKQTTIENLTKLEREYQSEFSKETSVDKKDEIQKKLEDVADRLIKWRKELDAELKKTPGGPGVTQAKPGNIVTEADKARWNTPANVDALATIVMSEASIGNAAERTTVAYSVLNRMKRNKKDSVKDVQGAYATNQQPTKEIKDFVASLLKCEVADNSAGATHFYSPRSMPKEGDENKPGFERFDTRGGLEKTEGVEKKNYKPSWAATDPKVDVDGARDSHYKFHRSPGGGTVR